MLSPTACAWFESGFGTILNIYPTFVPEINRGHLFTLRPPSSSPYSGPIRQSQIIMTAKLPFRFGVETLGILDILTSIKRTVEDSTNPYIDQASLLKMQIDSRIWSLRESDDFFECMTVADFASLKPSNPAEPVAVPIYPQNSPPSDVFGLEQCCKSVADMFRNLHKSKVAVDGCGCIWPKGPGFWVPRYNEQYEDLYDYRRYAPWVPYEVVGSYITTSAKPHMVYYVTHDDEGKECVISRSEVLILITTMKGRMRTPRYCTHIAPVDIPIPVTDNFGKADKFIDTHALNPQY